MNTIQKYTELDKIMPTFQHSNCLIRIHKKKTNKVCDLNYVAKAD